MDANWGITNDSLEFYKIYRPGFGPVNEAIVIADDTDGIERGYGPYGDRPSSPTLILRNLDGDEMWLSGCCCGYGGEGPSGTERILHAEGFHESLIGLVRTHGVLHVVRDSAAPIEAIPASRNAITSGPLRRGLQRLFFPARR